jgi:hypothetical protein
MQVGQHAEQRRQHDRRRRERSHDEADLRFVDFEVGGEHRQDRVEQGRA